MPTGPEDCQRLAFPEEAMGAGRYRLRVELEEGWWRNHEKPQWNWEAMCPQEDWLSLWLSGFLDGLRRTVRGWQVAFQLSLMGCPPLKMSDLGGISNSCCLEVKGYVRRKGFLFQAGKFRQGKVIPFSLSCKSNNLHRNLQHPFKTYSYLRKLYLS